MELPPLKQARIKLSSGTLVRGSYKAESKLFSLAGQYPYTQQIDVVFPSSEALENALQKLETRYWSCSCSLVQFLDSVRPDSTQNCLERGILALGLSEPNGTDVWSLDTRGVLTFAVQRSTYTRLGLVGKPLPWKACDDTFIIIISLSRDIQMHDAANRAQWHRYNEKVKAALQAWDAWRGSWNILYTFMEPEITNTLMPGSALRVIQPALRKTADVYVPLPNIRPCPQSTDKEQVQDWQEDMSALFEWTGMACLGAQRLRVNDHPDPYLAVYTPPTPSRPREITHLRWSGLLHPSFVQTIIDTCSTPGSNPSQFVTITMHGVSTSPVGYLNASGNASLRAPRSDTEDTRSLIISVAGSGSDPVKDQNYVLAESISQWDMRWG
ncbi:hypothetical protein OBBRIDRAFT_753113 [Obba rivulosa]|uniref:Uncharacterized protein n=1 Tax=Obba rivulosa TaxID=1052685 RepID=A0A8E2B089_9APHY|nr:hypothetical protein OBBRIDRAFT_753113 [Obba rivulosa]